MGIACHRQRSQTSSMEGMLHRYNLMICTSIFQIGILSRNFNCSFYSLCSAVCKKYFRQSCSFYQLFCRLRHRHVVIQIGRMNDFINLFLQSLTVFRMMIPQSKNSNARCKIQIFFSFCIIDPYSFSFFQNDRKTVVSM